MLIVTSWIQGCFGMRGGRTYSEDEPLDAATRVCSLGALGKATHVTGNQASRTQAAGFLACSMRSTNPKNRNAKSIIISTNDAGNTDKEFILACWDEAIKIARGAAAAACGRGDEA